MEKCKEMRTEEFREILRELNLSITDLSVLIGKTDACIRKWTGHYGEVKDCGTIVLLRLLRQRPELLSIAWDAYGLPGGRKGFRF